MPSTMGWLLSALVVTVAVGVNGHGMEERQERTMPTRCVPPNPCFPSRQMIAKFADDITGDVYQPSDVEYPSLVTAGADARKTSHPALIVMVENDKDVQEAVLFARKFYLMITVVSQAGDYSRGADIDAAMMINLSRLKSISTDLNPDNSTDPGIMTVGAGVTWAEAAAAAQAVNRELNTADWIANDQAVGEYLQGGGVGPKSRLLGLTTDSVEGIRVVTMDGSIITLSDAGATINGVLGTTTTNTLDPGLWRATRGAGAANFAIATSYTIRMYNYNGLRPTRVSASYPLYQDDQFVGRDILTFLLPYLTTLPPQWGGSVTLWGVPSATTVGRKGTVDVSLIHFGEYGSESYIAINELLNYDANGLRLSVSVQNLTRGVDTLQATVAGVEATREYMFSTLLPATAISDGDELDELVDDLLEVLNNPTVDSHYVCNLSPMGGAINTESDNAVPGSVRNAAMSVVCGLRWTDLDGLRDSLFIGHGLHYAEDIKDFGIGTLLSLGFYEDEPNWKHTLYGDNYKELMRVKRKYDVDNYLWCHNCVASDFRLDCRRGCERYGDDDHTRQLRERMEKDHDDDDMHHRDDNDPTVFFMNMGHHYDNMVERHHGK